MTVHLGSLLLGVMIGVSIWGILALVMLFTKAWGIGFNDGFKARKFFEKNYEEDKKQDGRFN